LTEENLFVSSTLGEIIEGGIPVNIIVLVKQVPDTENVKLDPETGIMIREGIDVVMNPFDSHGLELALRIKESRGGKVTVISMGPPNTEEVLREALALGADEAILLTDRIFAGSDTWATSFVLSEAIKRLSLDFDLIVCGEKATDGETGQVGPEVGALLDLPVITYVSNVIDVSDGEMVLERSVEDGVERWKVKLPALISVMRSVAEPRLPTLAGKKKALKMEIKVLNGKDLGFDPKKVGLPGSPTRVVSVFNTKVSRECVLYEGKELEEGLKKIIEILKPFVEGDGR